MSGQKNVRGQPAYIPNDKDRKIVKNCSAAAFSAERMADMIGVCSRTLERHYKKEMTVGRGLALLNVSAAMYQRAIDLKNGMTGTTAGIWFEKTRGGLRETSVVEHAGTDGNALPDRGNVVVYLPDNGRGLQLPPPKGRAPKMIEATAIKESDDD